MSNFIRLYGQLECPNLSAQLSDFMDKSLKLLLNDQDNHELKFEPLSFGEDSHL